MKTYKFGMLYQEQIGTELCRICGVIINERELYTDAPVISEAYTPVKKSPITTKSSDYEQEVLSKLHVRDSLETITRTH